MVSVLVVIMMLVSCVMNDVPGCPISQAENMQSNTAMTEDYEDDFL